MTDLLSVDVEDPGSSIRWDGGGPPPDRKRVERDCLATLDVLDRHRARATFFVVGEIAAAAPDIVREIARRGHEIGSHGMRHVPIAKLDREGFRADLGRSLEALAAAGATVRGFRAPWWSMPSELHWAIAEIEAAGLAYDSSVFPVRTSHYGNGRAAMTPHRIAGSRLWEIPPSCASFGPLRVPGPGGFFCRLYPAFLSRLLFRHAATRHLYFHSWEIAPGPSGPARPFERLIHGFGRTRMAAHLESLLAGSAFRPLHEAIA